MGRVCQGFLQCLLKLVNFLLILIGIAMIVYSLWMLNQWSSRQPPSESPPPAEPPIFPPPMQSPPPMQEVDSDAGYGDRLLVYKHVGRATWMIELEPTIQERFLRSKLPAPWFIYAFGAVGVIVLLITCTGHIAAETASGCCLCFYTLCLVLLLLAQAALAGVIIFDKKWKEAIPEDPTGEFHRIEHFIKRNFNICKWVALGVIVVEALSLFLAIVLRSIATGSQKDYDSDDDLPSRSARQPLLNRQATQSNPTPAAPVESRPPRNDAWSQRMREKYGLDTAEFTYNPVDSKRVPQQNAPAAEERKRCTIM